jgi:hypothetical protein
MTLLPWRHLLLHDKARNANTVLTVDPKGRWSAESIVNLIHKGICCLLFPTADLIENTQYYEIHSLLLPIYTVATTDKAMCKCYIEFLGAIPICISSISELHELILIY